MKGHENTEFHEDILRKYKGDPVLDSLVIYCKLNGRPYTQESLVAGLPIEQGRNTPTLFSKKSSKSLFSRAAARAGFRTKIFKTKLREINPLLLPSILLLHGRHSDDDVAACVLLGFNDEMTHARVILPELPDVENTVALAELEQRYFGISILLKKEIQLEEKELGIQSVRENHWFWGAFKIVKEIYRDVIVASFLINIFVLATPLFTMNVYDRVVPNGAVDTLWVLSIGIGVVYVVDVLLKFLRSYFLETAGKKTDIIASSIIFERILDLRMSSLPNSIGSLANIVKEFESIRSFLTSSTVTLLIDLPFVVIFLWVIYYIGGSVVLVPITVIILILLYTHYARGKLNESIKESYGAGSAKNGVLIESLSSIETLKALGSLGYAQWKWEEATADIAEKSINTKVISASITTITSFLLQLNTVLIIILGVYMIIDMNLSMGGLIAVVIISSRTIAPMGQVASLLATWEHTKTSYKALDDLMNLPVEHPHGKKFIARPEYRGKIDFRGVSFTYPGSAKETLRNVSFTIEPGEKVAVLGKIGSGKSTIQKMLTALYYADEGAILIDGIDIKQLDPAELRKNIAYVAQEPLLFSGTIKENIIYRAPHSDDEDFLRVAEVSGVMDFVQRHPKGFDIPVGEKGSLLSGGQRQCVSIARSLLLDSPMVLLDEPTNQMDSSTEQLFINRMRTYLATKTMILVTHKTSLLALVDRIIVLDEGLVVMDGSRDEIIQKLRS
ncbi:type I secretion system permease/ATPase [Chrysiogenes arsenatis]|uniref:type I secretion system permease/ATPase n=1 Tax=Chrysiogenes arsenatis TaxID=309797 RepID=UPI00040F57FD|nr:type I secretion system permease/ATPase [Chrysiogenes arsenatis]